MPSRGAPSLPRDEERIARIEREKAIFPLMVIRPLDDEETLRRLLRGLGSDACGIVPRGCELRLYSPEEAALERVLARPRFWRGVR